MSETNINVCQELLESLKGLEFNENSINKIKSNIQFINAYDKHHVLQRTMLTMLFYNILMFKDINIPIQVRLALNSGNDVLSWLDDIKLVILPFLKINEEIFF